MKCQVSFANSEWGVKSLAIERDDLQCDHVNVISLLEMNDEKFGKI